MQRHAAYSGPSPRHPARSPGGDHPAPCRFPYGNALYGRLGRGHRDGRSRRRGDGVGMPPEPGISHGACVARRNCATIIFAGPTASGHGPGGQTPGVSGTRRLPPAGFLFAHAASGAPTRGSTRLALSHAIKSSPGYKIFPEAVESPLRQNADARDRAHLRVAGPVEPVVIKSVCHEQPPPIARNHASSSVSRACGGAELAYRIPTPALSILGSDSV